MAFLGHTKAAVTLIWNEIKRIGFICGIAAHLFTIVYLITTFFTDTGLWYVNAILLALAIANAIFAIYFDKHEKEAKKLKKTVTTTYQWARRAIKLFTLGVTLYGLFLIPNNLNPFSLICPICIAAFWLFDVLIAIICMVVEARIDYILEGLAADFGELPLVGKYVKEGTGKGLDLGEPNEKLEKLRELAAASNEDWNLKVEQSKAYKKEKRKEKTKLFFQTMKTKLSKKESTQEKDDNES